MSESDILRCGNCKFYDANEAECRRYPPRIEFAYYDLFQAIALAAVKLSNVELEGDLRADISYGRQEVNTRGYWPSVSEEFDWCGEWQASQ